MSGIQLGDHLENAHPIDNAQMARPRNAADMRDLAANVRDLDDVLALLGGHPLEERKDQLDEDYQTSVRQQILSIQRDESLDAVTKARKMQELMSEKWKQSQQQQQLPEHACPSDDQQRQPTFHSPGVLGCSHYKRGCKMQAACCGRLYTCRFCHDAAEDHAIDRFATKNMLCMHCNTLQPVAQTCSNPTCGKQLAKYYCDVCKFWEDDPHKDIYHCPHCRICRVGKGLGIDFFHCMTCNACMTIARKEKHRCIERALESACPICHCGSMFTSTEPVVFAVCGHCMHEACFKQYIRSSFTCPICCKALYDATTLYKRIDEEMARHQMPEQFRSRMSDILCNDCEQRSRVPYHFMYHKCGHCGGYNTRVV